MKKKALAILLSLAMVFSLFPVSAFASGTTSGFSDMPSDWSTKALENAVSNGLLVGDNGKIMPNDNLTRAQMAAIVNRAFGTTEKASLSSYTDVAANAWYYDDMAKAVQMKTFVGSGDKLNPDSNISREEAFAVLARAFKLSGAAASALDKFSDKALVSSWAKDAAASLISAGHIAGSNSQLNPNQNITRAEFAQIMDNLLKNYIKTAGTYTTDYTGNVMINVPGVTLKDIKITGDLIIGDGVGNGDVTLDGITVTGRTIIRGGGVNSIKIIGNSNLQNIIIARVDGQVRVYAEDGTQIGEVIVDGSDNVTIEGNFGAVTVTAPDITVTATNADIVDATIVGDRSIIIVSDKSTIKTANIEGDNAKIITLTGAKIGDIIANGEGSIISGTGTIGTVEANGNNTAVTTPGTSVTAATGTTGVTAGTTSVLPGTTETVTSESNGGGGGGGGSSSVAVSAINVTPTTMTLTAGGATGTLTKTVAPADATNQTVTWSSSNTSIATVVNGVVTPVAAGAATITATSAADGTKTGTCVVTVNAALPAMTGTVAISGTEKFGQILTATPTLTNAGTPTYQWNRGGVAISGATGTTYTLVEADITTVITVTATADGTVGTGTITSAATGAIAKADGPAAPAAPTEASKTDTSVTLTANALNQFSKDAGVNWQDSEVFTGLTAETAYTFVARVKATITSNESVASVGTAVTTDAAAPVSDYTYTTTAGNVTITGYTGSDTVITIPSTLGGNPVTIIGDHAFQNKTTLTSVTIPIDVTSIGFQAFNSCTSLTSVIIPNSVTSIGNEAFLGCTSLTSVTIGSGVTSIGDYEFYGCTALTSITIPSNVTSIGIYAFYGCTSLTSVSIPGSVTSIGIYAFSGCTALTSVIIPNSVTSIGVSAFSGCTALTSVIMGRTDTAISDNLMDNTTNNYFQVAYLAGKAGTYTGTLAGDWTRLSSDATLKASSTVKGQVVIGLGTPNAVLATATSGTVTITAAEAVDTTNAGSFITLFDKTNAGATVKVVKYASGVDPTATFATDAAYANEAITDTDFFIARVTAADTSTVLYYKVVVTLIFSIGDSYGGGIIAYIDGSGRHGLIAATTDQSSSIWSNITGSSVGSTGTVIGTGQANTTTIIGQVSHTGSAAKLCDDLVVGSYSDWYLPSLNELNQLCLNRVAIGNFVSGGNYWSSSEYDASHAWYQHFYVDANQLSGTKSPGQLNVRAVRSF